MQAIIVIIIVCLAALFLIKTLIKKFATKTDCDCGCAGCSSAGTCENKENHKEGPF